MQCRLRGVLANASCFNVQQRSLMDEYKVHTLLVGYGVHRVVPYRITGFTPKCRAGEGHDNRELTLPVLLPARAVVSW